MSFNLKKHFRNFGGQDLRSPELLRDDTTATETLNVSLSENLSLTKRRGFQITSSGVGGAGSVTFNTVDIATGIETVSRLVMDDNLHKRVQGTIELTYSGMGTPSVSIRPSEEGKMVMYLYEDADIIQEIDLGVGTSVTDDMNIIDALMPMAAPFSYTLTGPPTINAAFIRVLPETSFDTTFDLNFDHFEQIDTAPGVTNPFAGHWATVNDDKFELADTAQAREVLYITNGVDGLFKYDESKVYKAGLPKPSDLVAGPVSGPTGTFRYRAVLRHTDNKDNIIFSTPSNELEVAQTGEITVPAIPVGYDEANIEVLLLRTKDNGSIFFVVDTLPYNNAGTVFNDSETDANLLEDYTLPPFELNLTPVCRYIDIWRDQIVLTGESTIVSKVFYSDIEYPEGFSESNTFLSSGRSGGANSGIKSHDNYLYVFKPNSIDTVTGDLGTGQFQVDTLTDEGIGCLSNQSIVEAQGKIWFLGRRGIYSLDRQGLTLESSPLSPIFTLELQKIRTLRSVGFYWINEEVIMFSLPEKVTSPLASETTFNPESRVLAYHIQSRVWTIWNNIEMSGGVSQDGDEVWFSGSYENAAGGVTYTSSQFLRTLNRIDYADHVSPIKSEYKTNWETLGEPSVPKKFVRLKIFSLDTPLQAFESTDFSIDIETNHEYVDEVVSKTSLAFSEPTGGWGEFPWGETAWGEIKSLTRRTRLKPQKTRSIRVFLGNSNLHENILVSGFEFEVAYEHGNYQRNR